MDKVLLHNIKNAKFVIGTMVIGSYLFQKCICMPHLKNYQNFGYDGNGGQVLKIVTNLTDDEISRLKTTRRMMWHLRLPRKFGYNKHLISDAELADRGIPIDKPAFIEYDKRPPHDMYL